MARRALLWSVKTVTKKVIAKARIRTHPRHITKTNEKDATATGPNALGWKNVPERRPSTKSSPRVLKFVVAAVGARRNRSRDAAHITNESTERNRPSVADLLPSIAPAAKRKLSKVGEAESSPCRFGVNSRKPTIKPAAQPNRSSAGVVAARRPRFCIKSKRRAIAAATEIAELRLVNGKSSSLHAAHNSGTIRNSIFQGSESHR
jgi:hypothetical protein